MTLKIEQAWVIECDRCTNMETQPGDKAEAEHVWEVLGWKQDVDGFQMCPQCWGKP